MIGKEAALGVSLDEIAARLEIMSTSWRIVVNRKSISWLLVIAVLSTMLLPAHYHLHHLYSDDAAEHAHSIDLHVIALKVDQSHHDDASIFSATPDAMVKKSNPEFPPFIILAILLILLPTCVTSTCLRSDQADHGLKKRFPHFSPPLRAPPLR